MPQRPKLWIFTCVYYTPKKTPEVDIQVKGSVEEMEGLLTDFKVHQLEDVDDEERDDLDSEMSDLDVPGEVGRHSEWFDTHGKPSWSYYRVECF